MLPTTFSSYLRKMVKVLRVGLGPHCYSVHLVVEPIQKKAKKLLSILLTKPKEKRASNPSSPKTLLLLPPPPPTPEEDTSAKVLTYSRQSAVRISGSGSWIQMGSPHHWERKSIWSGLVLQTLWKGEGREGVWRTGETFSVSNSETRIPKKVAKERKTGERHIKHNYWYSNSRVEKVSTGEAELCPWMGSSPSMRAVCVLLLWLRSLI